MEFLHAGLAGMDMAAVLRGDAAEIEHLDLEIALRRKDLAGDLEQAPALGHLAWTGLVIARRAVDQQHARLGGCRLLLFLGAQNGLARLGPFDGKLIRRIGIAGAGWAGSRRPAIFVLAVPRDVDDALDLVVDRGEGRIVEALAHAAGERRLVQCNAWHPLADVRHGRFPRFQKDSLAAFEGYALDHGV